MPTFSTEARLLGLSCGELGGVFSKYILYGFRPLFSAKKYTMECMNGRPDEFWHPGRKPVDPPVTGRCDVGGLKIGR